MTCRFERGDTMSSFFRITGVTGFHIRFANGWTVSVQFGPCNYCEHHDREVGREEAICGKEGSATAECAVWGPDGEFVEYGTWGGRVGGWMDSEHVLELLTWAASQPANAKARGDTDSVPF